MVRLTVDGGTDFRALTSGLAKAGYDYTEVIFQDPADPAVYSKVWFNTAELCSGCYQSKYIHRGIKPDGIINFLSNEPPVE
jgi:hypothetical protein